jgi:hypothetical protein
LSNHSLTPQNISLFSRESLVKIKGYCPSVRHTYPFHKTKCLQLPQANTCPFLVWSLVEMSRCQALSRLKIRTRWTCRNHLNSDKHPGVFDVEQNPPMRSLETLRALFHISILPEKGRSYVRRIKEEKTLQQSSSLKSVV